MGEQVEAGARIMDVQFYGFLHLRDTEQSTVNVQVSSFLDQVRIYCSNALALKRSLQTYGLPFTLLTNSPDTIARAHPEAAREISLDTIPFHTSVPEGIRFFSGHYKLDVFRYLGSLGSHYVALLDLDMLAINPPPDAFALAVEKQIPMAYDITDQVAPSAPPGSLKSQLEDILQRPSPGTWSGGEFLSGSPKFFADLTAACESIYDRYVELIPTAARVGNEPYQSAAIDILRHEGMRIDDAGQTGVVARYWNMWTKHTQPPFREFTSHFLLHLPVDKFILQKISRRGPLQAGQALQLYKSMKWQWVFLELLARARKFLMRRGDK